MRLKSLDVLRALAVLLVMGRHFEIQPAWNRGGWIGVDLFFVLSGFLISGLLFTEYQRHGRIRVGNFLLRRGFKIYPPFYLLILGTAVLFLLFQRPIPVTRLLAECFFVQNYHSGLWDHTWSLAVEEHFYLALPLLLLSLCRLSGSRRDPFRWLPVIFLGVALFVSSSRLYLALQWPLATAAAAQGATQLRMDELLFGVLLAYLLHFRREWFERLQAVPAWLLALFSFLAVAPGFFVNVEQSLFVQTVGHILLYLGFGGWLLLALRPDSQRWLERKSWAAGLGRGLAWMGAYSYSIYLWHVPVASWGMEALRRTGYLPASRAAQVALYLAGSILLGVAMARLVETPSLRLRDRLFPSRSSVPVERPAPAGSKLPFGSPVTEAG
jgi:peptidoglycan/LPS O-acetylase OafA/YrhL